MAHAQELRTAVTVVAGGLAAILAAIALGHFIGAWDIQNRIDVDLYPPTGDADVDASSDALEESIDKIYAHDRDMHLAYGAAYSAGTALSALVAFIARPRRK